MPKILEIKENHENNTAIVRFDDSVYNGGWRDGAMHGKGIWSFLDGGTY